MCFSHKVSVFALQGPTFEDICHTAIALLLPMLRTVIRIDRNQPFAVSDTHYITSVKRSFR